MTTTTEESAESSPPCRQGRVLSKEDLEKNRMWMTILHFLLTYPRWSFTLFLLLANRSLVLPSTQDAIHEPLGALRTLANQESQLYRQCVAEAYDRIQEYMNETVQSEYTRITRMRQEENLPILQKAESTSGACFNASLAARRALQTWQSRAQLPIANDTATCSASDRANLTEILGQDYNLVQYELFGVMDSYTSASQSSLQRVISYTQSRVDYDYNYFIGVKIQATIDGLQAFDVPDVALNVNVLDELLALLQAILDALNDAYIRVDLLTARLLQFQTSIQGFHLNYLDIYGRLSLASDFVRDFLPAGVPLPPYLDLTGIPVADLLLPPTLDLPNFAAMLPNIDDLVTDYIQKLVELISRILVEIAEKAEEQIRLILEELLEQLRNLLTLEDYNPPQYVGSHGGIGSIFDELDFLDALGQAARQRTRAALQRLQNVDGVSFETRAPDINFTIPDIEENTTNFGYLEPQFPTISIPRFIRFAFGWIVAHHWIIEFVVQFFRLRRLIKRYERSSSPDLPEIDYSEEEQVEEKKQTSTFALLQLTVLKHFLTPWMALGLILLPFAILGVTVWFPHVRNGCVHSRSGTVVGRNLVAPLVINKANVAGNALYSASELQCRQQQRRLCNQMFADSDLLYRSDQASLSAAQDRFAAAVEINDLLDRCIVVDELDEDVHTHCCGLEGYGSVCDASSQRTELCPIDNTTEPPASFRPLGESLSAPSCSANISAPGLKDTRFDCGVLQDTCSNVPCDSVDSDLLRYLSIETDCRIEVFIIKCCLLVLLALYHGVMMNLFSTLFFSAIKHIQWRKLCPTGIKLRTEMDEQGALIWGSDPSDRSSRIAAAMRRFELLGWVQLGLAAALFLIWFISFFVLRLLLSDFNSA